MKQSRKVSRFVDCPALPSCGTQVNSLETDSSAKLNSKWPFGIQSRTVRRNDGSIPRNSTSSSSFDNSFKSHDGFGKQQISDDLTSSFQLGKLKRRARRSTQTDAVQEHLNQLKRKQSLAMSDVPIKKMKEPSNSGPQNFLPQFSSTPTPPLNQQYTLSSKNFSFGFWNGHGMNLPSPSNARPERDDSCTSAVKDVPCRLPWSAVVTSVRTDTVVRSDPNIGQKTSWEFTERSGLHGKMIQNTVSRKEFIGLFGSVHPSILEEIPESKHCSCCTTRSTNDTWLADQPGSFFDTKDFPREDDGNEESDYQFSPLFSNSIFPRNKRSLFEE